MRHLVRKKRLGRHSSHRIAMFRNMVTSLIEEERITTTLIKAKELRRVAERMVTLAKNRTLHSRRQADSVVRTNDAVRKLFSELATRFRDRPGGYTRVLKLGYRRGDGAPMALIEYLGFQPRVAKPGAKEEKPKSSKKEKAAKERTAEPKAEKKKAEEKPAKAKKEDKKEKKEKKK